MALIPSAVTPASIDSTAMRRAGRDLLSLALMDARNHTLHLLGRVDAACTAVTVQAGGSGAAPDPGRWLWLAGQLGWFAEYWIARNTQRALGAACPPRPTRLASVDPLADAWWGEAGAPGPAGGTSALADPDATRAYLLETLEGTLALLEKSAEDDDALYFYRLALFHEDLRGEQMLALAQAHGLPVKAELPPGLRLREPLACPAVRWTLGCPPGEGFAFDCESGRLEVAVPEFEIDAQPVSWAQYVEFVDDGGYDRAEFWAPAGWAWLQQQAEGEGRRGPRYVEQIGLAQRGGAVLQASFGRSVRLAGNQLVIHASWWEADAWCRWAGRRLPSEAEWEIAARTAVARGFRWGDVHEWTSTLLRPWPGFRAGPWADYAQPWFERARVLRGASFATRARLKHPQRRGFALPEADEGFVGFRSCAL